MKTSVHKQLPSVLITPNDSFSSTSQLRMRHVSCAVRLSSIVIFLSYALLNNYVLVYHLSFRLFYKIINIVIMIYIYVHHETSLLFILY